MVVEDYVENSDEDNTNKEVATGIGNEDDNRKQAARALVNITNEKGDNNGEQLTDKENEVVKGLSAAQIKAVFKLHTSGNSDWDTYLEQAMNDINTFAQVKVFYLMPFVTNDKAIEYGSKIQKEVSKEVGIAPEMDWKVWEIGGKECFRNALATKRKTVMLGVRKACEKCE